MPDPFASDRQDGLKGRRVLVVEDEFLIAADLADYFTRLGATVLGPARTLAQGFALAPEAEAAVLDVSLRGERVFPLAEALLARNVPFVFFTACTGIVIPPGLDAVGRFVKPASYARLGQALSARLDGEEGEEDDLVRLLPKLRMSARLLVGDAAAADRLVERALVRAVETLASRDRSLSLEDWVVTVMRGLSEAERRGAMN